MKITHTITISLSPENAASIIDVQASLAEGDTLAARRKVARADLKDDIQEAQENLDEFEDLLERTTCDWLREYLGDAVDKFTIRIRESRTPTKTKRTKRHG